MEKSVIFIYMLDIGREIHLRGCLFDGIINSKRFNAKINE